MLPQKRIATPRVRGRYELKEVIGRGGMGLVYRAYDTVIRRDVALKTIKDIPERGELELFRKECGVLASLSHPNIIEIFDIGEFEEDGEKKPYFVMPLLPGVTLDHLIHNAAQQLTVGRSLEIIFQTCRGLHAAHENGLVHRDMKPSNIFVMQDDSVKIIDFGVAHMVDSRTSMTIKGGTLPYMAPEQLQFQKVSPLSDLFSLGVVLYETLTRKRPFEGHTEAELAEAIKSHSPPPASELNRDVNQTVSRVVHKAMAKQSCYRFASIKEFAETLQKAQRNEPIEFFNPIRIRPRIQRAAKATDGGNYEFASEILAELEAEGHVDPDISLLRSQIDQGSRQRTVQQLLDNARARIEAEEFPLAFQKVEEALRLHPGNVAALTLKRTLEVKRNESKIDECFLLARKHLDNRSFDDARRAIQNVLQLKPKDARALQMLAEVDHRDQEYLRIRNEKEQIYQSALEAWQSGEVSATLTKLERLIELDRRAPDSSSPQLGVSIQTFYRQVRNEHEAMKTSYEETRKHLADRNFVLAQLICDQYLAKYPGNAIFRALKFDVEEGQRQELSARIAEIDHCVGAEPDLERKVTILKEALDLHPGEGHFERSLRLLRDKSDLVDSIVAKARNYEEHGQFNEALGQWEILQSVYDQYPRVELEIQRVTQRGEQQSRAEAKARWAELIDHQLEAGGYSRAWSVSQEGLVEFPGDPELAALAMLARRGVDRALEAQRLLALGSELWAQNKIEEGLASLLKALETDIHNAALRGEVLEALLTQSQVALETDPPLADALLQKVLDFDPENLLANSLQSLNKGRHREEFVARCIASARQFQADSHVDEALKQIDQALSSYPEEARLKQLQATLRKAREESIVRCLAKASQLRSAGDLNGALEQLRQGLSQCPTEPRLSQSVAAVEKLYEESERKRREIVSQYIEQARRLESAGDLTSALEQVDQGLSFYPEEPHLRQLATKYRKSIEDARRQELVTHCLNEVRHLQKAGDLHGLREAVRLLHETLGRFPAESEINQMLTVVQDQLRAREREDAIAGLIRDAQSLAAKRDFGSALESIANGLQKWPGESSLVALHQAISADQMSWRRRRAIEQLTEQAEELARQGHFEEALNLLAKAPKDLEDDASLLELRKRIDGDWKRAKAIDKAAAAIRSLIQENRLSEAHQCASESFAKYPDQAVLESLLGQVQEGLTAQQQREEFARDSETLIRKGQLEEAAALLSRALKQFPGDDGFASLLRGVGADVQARRHAEGVDNLAAEACTMADAGKYGAALDLLERGLQSWPGEKDLLDIQQSIQARKTAFQKEQALKEELERAGRLSRENRFSEALQSIEAALRECPNRQELIQLQQQLRLRMNLEDSRKLLDEARPAEALQLLNQLTAVPDLEQELKALIRRARREVEELERAAKVVKLRKDARDHADAGEFDKALALVERALGELPNEPGVIETRDQIVAEKRAWLQRQAILDATRQCEELERTGHFAEALKRVEGFIHEFERAPKLLEVRERVSARLLAEESKQIRQRDLDALKKLIESVSTSSKPPDVPELRNRARRIVAQYPADQEIRSTGAAFIQHLSALADAQRELAKLNFDGALTIVREHLAAYPNHSAFERLKAKAEEGKKLQYLEEFEHRLATEENLDSCARSLEEALRRYPQESWLQDELQLVQERLGRVKSILEKVLVHEAAGKWDEALDQWNALGTIYKAYPNLEAELERVRAKRDQMRETALARWADEIRRALDARDLARAEESLRLVPAQFANDDALKSLAIAVEQLRQQKARARELLFQGRADFDNGRHPDGLTKLRQAFELDRGDAAFRKLVCKELVRAARRAVDDQWQQAEELLQQADALDPEHHAPKDLLLTIARRKREEIVAECLRHTEELRSAGDFHTALAEVERLLLSYPDEALLRNLVDELNVAEAAWRTQAIEETLRNCDRLRQHNRLSEAEELVEAAIRKHGDVPVLTEVRDGLEVYIREAAQRARRDGDLNELNRLNREAQSISNPEHREEILERVRLISHDYQDDTDIQSAAARILSQIEGLRRAEEQLAERNHSKSVQICEEYLANDPGHPGFQEIRRRAKAMARLAAIQEASRAIAAERLLKRRVELLSEAARNFPEEPSISEELQSAQSRLVEVTATVERARAYEAAGDIEDAIESWKRVRAIDRDHPGLDAEIERILGKQASIHAVALNDWVGRIKPLLEAEDYLAAAEILRDALSEFPEEAQLAELNVRLREGLSRKAEAKALLSQAEEMGLDAKYEQATEKLQRALELERHDPGFRRDVLDLFVKLAETALETDSGSAESLLEQASAVDPRLNLTKLKARIAHRKRQEFIDHCLTHSGSLEAIGDLRGALTQIQVGLSTYPDELPLREFSQKLLARLKELREQDLVELRAMLLETEAAASTAELKAILVRASSTATSYAGDNLIQSVASEVTVAINAKVFENTRKRRSLFMKSGAAVLVATSIGIAAFFLMKPSSVPGVRISPEPIKTVGSLPSAPPAAGSESKPPELPPRPPSRLPDPTPKIPSATLPDSSLAETKDWKSIKDSSDSAKFDEFQRKYPSSPHFEEAGRKKERIASKKAWEQFQRDKKLAETKPLEVPPSPSLTPSPLPNLPLNIPAANPRIGETEDWESVKNSSDSAAFEKFRTRYPSSSHFEEAGRKIEDLIWGGISKRNQKALQDYVVAHPGGVHTQEAQSILEILNVLDDLKKAFATKNKKDILAIYPSLPPILKTNFNDSSSMQMILNPLEEPKTAKDAASVVCAQTLEIIFPEKRVLRSNLKVKVDFGRVNGKWHISRITPL